MIISSACSVVYRTSVEMEKDERFEMFEDGERGEVLRRDMLTRAVVVPVKVVAKCDVTVCRR